MLKILTLGKRISSPVLFFIILGLLAALFVEKQNSRQLEKVLLSQVEKSDAEIAVRQNKIRSLNSALAKSKGNNQELLELIASLEKRLDNIETIIVVETPIEGDVTETEEIPDEHLFKGPTGVVVARFKKGPPHIFETYDLDLKIDLAVGEKNSAAKVKIKSAYEPIWFDVPAELTVTNIREQKFFAPEVGLGLTASSNPDIGAALFMTFIHPNENLDFGGVRLTSNGHLGLDLVGYNVGTFLPIVDDLWLYAGGSINTNADTSIDLTIGTKF